LGCDSRLGEMKLPRRFGNFAALGDNQEGM
jgi:hypothetical protein